MYHASKDLFLSWLAGVIDGDGCFTVSLTKQYNSKTPRLTVWAQICITSRQDESWYLDYVQKELGFGKLYTKKASRSQRYPVVTYQTTNLKDGVRLSKMVLPYLVLKKDKCEKFIEFASYWLKTNNPDKRGLPEGRGKSRRKGDKIRTQEDILKAVRVACSINANRQTRRYKDKLTYEQWKPLIKEWYPK